MNIKDYITLAKAGYMPADIKDITEKHPEVSTDDLITMSKSGYKPNDVKELFSLPVDTTTDPAPKVAPAAGEVVGSEKEVDYKTLYESTKIELDKAHAENIHKDISGGLSDSPSDADIITKAFENFM